MRSEDNSKGIINVDLDGVIYDFDEALRVWLRRRGYARDFPEPTTWNYWEQWGMTAGEWMAQFRTAVEADFMWRQGDPIEGAVNGMWKLSDAGFFIRIVTHRLVHPFGHQKAVESTVEWLGKESIPYSSIAFLGKEGKENYEGIALIDDNFINAEVFGSTDDMSDGLLFDKPYNQREVTWSHRVGGWGAVTEWFGA